MKMRFKDDRGSYTIEALFIFPLLLVFFVLTFWFGTLMYTWSTVNYASMQYALDIAKEGQKNRRHYKRSEGKAWKRPNQRRDKI